jgi:hypothetical protein
MAIDHVKDFLIRSLGTYSFHKIQTSSCAESSSCFEVPLRKVIFLKVEKGIINYIMIISINTKRGMRSFYYRLGNLPEHQGDKFKKMSDLISYVKNRT